MTARIFTFVHRHPRIVLLATAGPLAILLAGSILEGVTGISLF